jgi:hypothetical protein
VHAFDSDQAVIFVLAIADFFVLEVSALAAPSTHQDQGPGVEKIPFFE